jgi:hypothetical protein
MASIVSANAAGFTLSNTKYSGMSFSSFVF